MARMSLKVFKFLIRVAVFKKLRGYAVLMSAKSLFEPKIGSLHHFGSFLFLINNLIALHNISTVKQYQYSPIIIIKIVLKAQKLFSLLQPLQNIQRLSCSSKMSGQITGAGRDGRRFLSCFSCGFLAFPSKWISRRSLPCLFWAPSSPPAGACVELHEKSIVVLSTIFMLLGREVVFGLVCRFWWFRDFEFSLFSNLGLTPTLWSSDSFRKHPQPPICQSPGRLKTAAGKHYSPERLLQSLLAQGLA